MKAVLFIVYTISFAFFIATNSREWPTLSEQIFLGIFLACLCFWGILGLLNGESETKQVFLQLKDISSTVLIAWFCVFFVRRKLLEPESVVRSVVFAAAVVGVIKVALVLAIFAFKVNPVLLIESTFGEGSLVSGDIGLGLTRLGFSSDIVGGFALFVVLCPSVSGVRLRRSYIALCVVALLASGLMSYARYIWFIYLFALVAACVIERRFKLLLFSFLAVAVLALAGYDVVAPMVSSRFSSEQTSDSDLTRIEQSKALLDEIEARPILGKGIGQHAHQLIRSEQNLYSYELQWMSLMMQTGAVGIAAILLLVVAAARDLLAVRYRARPWLAALFIFWLLGSWTNPYLMSSFAGATFGMFMSIFYRMRVIVEETGLPDIGSEPLPSATGSGS